MSTSSQNKKNKPARFFHDAHPSREVSVHTTGKSHAEIVDCLVNEIKSSIYSGLNPKAEDPEEGTALNKDDLMRDYAMQQNSFWAMVFAEYWHIVNFIIDNSSTIFAAEMGYSWATRKDGGKYMVSEDPDAMDPRFARMLAAIMHCIASISSNMQCILNPVGMQHKFYMHMLQIKNIVSHLVDCLCSPCSFLGECNPECGGEVGTPGPRVHRSVRSYVKHLRPCRGRGAAACATLRFRSDWVHGWMTIRDMFINLQPMITNAMFITEMFMQVIQSAGDATELFDNETVQEARAEDEFYFGYRLREADMVRAAKEGRSIHSSYTPFDYIKFAFNLSGHTGCPVMNYLSPIYALYKNCTQVEGGDSIQIGAYIRAWRNTFSITHASVLLSIHQRSQSEWPKYREVIPDGWVPFTPGKADFGPMTSVCMRFYINNAHHKINVSSTSGGSNTQAISPILPRGGVDDFHRESTNPNDNSFFLNWVAELVKVHPDTVDNSDEFFRPAEKVIVGHISATTEHTIAQRDLVLEVEAEKEEKRAEKERIEEQRAHNKLKQQKMHEEKVAKDSADSKAVLDEVKQKKKKINQKLKHRQAKRKQVAHGMVLPSKPTSSRTALTKSQAAPLSTTSKPPLVALTPKPPAASPTPEPIVTVASTGHVASVRPQAASTTALPNPPPAAKSAMVVRSGFMTNGAAMAIQHTWRLSSYGKRLAWRQAKERKAKQAELAALVKAEMVFRIEAAKRIQPWARTVLRRRALTRAVRQIVATRRASRYLLADVQAYGRAKTAVRRMKVLRAVKAIATWYRTTLARWMNKLRVVRFDTDAYLIRVRRMELEARWLFKLRWEEMDARYNHKVRAMEAAYMLITRLRDQLEWFFVTNLPRDQYLLGYLNNYGVVPAFVVLGFPSIQKIIAPHQDHFHAMFQACAMSSNVQIFLDSAGNPVLRPTPLCRA
jgi:hypothetical protein